MKKRKVIAPLIITISLLIYFSLIIIGFLFVPEERLFLFLAIIPILILIGFTIFAFIDRVDELRSDEKDDLGKY